MVEPAGITLIPTNLYAYAHSTNGLWVDGRLVGFIHNGMVADRVMELLDRYGLVDVPTFYDAQEREA